METLVIEAMAIGGVALTSGIGWLIWRKATPVPPAIDTDVPMIEIDGKLVPHPTIIARRRRRAESL